MIVERMRAGINGGTQCKVKSWGIEPKSLVEGDTGLLRGDLSGPIERQTDAGRGGGGRG